jgi:hypothetical protein
VGYSVVLYHPGAKLPEKFHSKTRDLAAVVVNMGALLHRAAKDQATTLSVILYDKTITAMDPAMAPQFLTGGDIIVDASTNPQGPQVTLYNETDYDAIVRNAGRLFYEDEMEIGGRQWGVVILPVQGTYETDLTSVITSGVMIFVASALLAVWMIHNMHQSIAMQRVISQAAAEASIVANLFPPNVRERMIQDAQLKHKRRQELIKGKTQEGKDLFANNKTGERSVLSKTRLNTLLTSEGIFGSKPIAELHPYTTLVSTS